MTAKLASLSWNILLLLPFDATLCFVGLCLHRGRQPLAFASLCRKFSRHTGSRIHLKWRRPAYLNCMYWSSRDTLHFLDRGVIPKALPVVIRFESYLTRSVLVSNREFLATHYGFRSGVKLNHTLNLDEKYFGEKGVTRHLLTLGCSWKAGAGRICIRRCPWPRVRMWHTWSANTNVWKLCEDVPDLIYQWVHSLVAQVMSKVVKVDGPEHGSR